MFGTATKINDEFSHPEHEKYLQNLLHPDSPQSLIKDQSWYNNYQQEWYSHQKVENEKRYQQQFSENQGNLDEIQQQLIVTQNKLQNYPENQQFQQQKQRKSRNFHKQQCQQQQYLNEQYSMQQQRQLEELYYFQFNIQSNISQIGEKYSTIMTLVKGLRSGDAEMLQVAPAIIDELHKSSSQYNLLSNQNLNQNFSRTKIDGQSCAIASAALAANEGDFVAAWISVLNLATKVFYEEYLQLCQMYYSIQHQILKAGQNIEGILNQNQLQERMQKQFFSCNYFSPAEFLQDCVVSHQKQVQVDAQNKQQQLDYNEYIRMFSLDSPQESISKADQNSYNQSNENRNILNKLDENGVNLVNPVKNTNSSNNIQVENINAEYLEQCMDEILDCPDSLMYEFDIDEMFLSRKVSREDV
eukprot:TRINITY_DN1868_c1_g2_i2.p1 TRINITY_DN1868_c1_g2~~TRINITY_DN1868_c1_g2_i2.p1  ORF type:complete len:457 (+),score=39.13 TRINITY_DN1868_c1_g2_i2:130-1371(+)